MSDAEKQEGQKTVVSFIAGLLIGGLLVWIFGGSPETKTTPVDEENNAVTETTDDVAEVTDQEDTVVVATEGGESTEEVDVTTPTMNVGEGELVILNQPAGSSVALASATFPQSDGWVAVRSYNNGQLGSILGAARFSEEQGLIPEEVPLLVPTTAGRTYAAVFFTEDGNRDFNLSGDVQVDGIMTTFEVE